MTEDLPHRKRTRLEKYDYSSPGAYFFTICTAERKCLLSSVRSVGEGLAPPVLDLSPIGQIAEKELLSLSDRFPSVSADKFVIMPNHIHILLIMHETAGGASPSPTVMDVVGSYKSVVTRASRPLLGESALFQRSFHDHVVRGENDYRELWRYIESNPARWREDRLCGEDLKK